VYYKVPPPSERNELNLSLLKTTPEWEIGTNASNDIGVRWADGFSRGFKHSVDKLSGQNHTDVFNK